MNWVLLFFCFTFSSQAYGKQASSVETVVKQNLPDGTVRLDPLFRRALLRALTELEREAQEKVRDEESRIVRSEGKNTGNFVNNIQEDNIEGEIQNTADTSYPTPNPQDHVEVTTYRPELNTEVVSPANVQETFFQQSSVTIEDNVNAAQEQPKDPSPTLHPSDIATNLIVEELNGKERDTVNEETNRAALATNDKKDDSNEKKEGGNDIQQEIRKPDVNDTEVDIFKAPLVAAFTLHQDSKGTPHSVIPLFRKELQQNQRQQVLNQQFLQSQQQQFLQNQFIPGVSISSPSQANQFNQQQSSFFSSGSVSPNFASSTTFPPLSNSILTQNFPSAISSQNFQGSSTIAPFSGNQGFISTISPQRNNFQSTLLPSQDFSVVQSHNFNFSPTPQPTFPSTVAPVPGFQPISIPPVTLPLQNEPRFQSSIVVPSLQVNPEQAFLQNQEQQRLRNQFLIEEKNRQRFLEEQNRQRQIEEQNRQRQLEQQRQRQIEEQNRQKQLLEQNLRQQRQEQGVDFQRSLGFSFNQNLQTKLNAPLPTQSNGFNFHIQPSQSFLPSINFQDLEARNRVNRQEGFGSTGNLGLVNNQQSFGNAPNQFQNNQIFPPFQPSQEYRTIREEHYRNLPTNNFQQFNNRVPQFRQQNNFQQNNVQSVNKQLQNLLFQSGVAADAAGQEDLNIVSKVLALNHERSDSNIDHTIIRNERKSEESFDKTIGVGEIKDVDNSKEFTHTQ